MNKVAGIVALALVFVMSACGPLRRLRNPPGSPKDSISVALRAADSAFAAPDSALIAAGAELERWRSADSPGRLGPFVDSVIPVQAIDTPELADDSKMPMPWWMQQLQYATFSGKAKAHFESPEESRDFTLTVRIESGKRIWMSVVGSALGISMEAFRAVLKPDSMIAINRIDKEVIRAPFSEIGSLFPVDGDFYSLEAVLVGNRLPGASQLGLISPDTIDGNAVVRGSLPAGSQSLTFRLADSTMIRQHVSTRESVTEMQYENYEAVGDRTFSRKRALVIENGAGRQTLNLEYTSYSFDAPVDMSFTIPEKYKRR